MRYRPQASVNTYCLQSTVIQLFQSKEMLGLSIFRKQAPKFHFSNTKQGTKLFLPEYSPCHNIVQKEGRIKKKTKFKSIEKSETLVINCTEL